MLRTQVSSNRAPSPWLCRAARMAKCPYAYHAAQVTGPTLSQHHVSTLCYFKFLRERHRKGRQSILQKMFIQQNRALHPSACSGSVIRSHLVPANAVPMPTAVISPWAGRQNTGRSHTGGCSPPGSARAPSRTAMVPPERHFLQGKQKE